MIGRIIRKVNAGIRRRRHLSVATLAEGSCIHPEGSLESAVTGARAIAIGAHTHVRGQIGCYSGSAGISIGEYCYVGTNSKIWAWKSVIIKNRVLIAHNVSIFDSDTHPMDSEERARHFRDIILMGHRCEADVRPRDVIIEDDAWIGCNSVITKGVVIGRGSIVGAGSVVTKSVGDWCVVAGAPARVIRRLKN